MFGRRKKASTSEGAEVFAGLRDQILTLDPSNVGLAADGSFSSWGFLMETGYTGATASIVCLRDGTTSLYTSSGFGIIGGGGHETVRAANARLFTELDQHLDEFAATTDTALPVEGETVLRALTYDGQLIRARPEMEFGQRRDACSGVFYAAQDVLTELRIIEEARRGNE